MEMLHQNFSAYFVHEYDNADSPNAGFCTRNGIAAGTGDRGKRSQDYRGSD